MRNFPNSESEVAFSGTYWGIRAEVPMMPQGGETTNLVAEVIPFAMGGNGPIYNTTGTWVLSFTTHGDTVPPPTSFSTITVTPGLKSALVQVNPTSYGDLWGHQFFRHTANCYTAATSIGFGTRTFLDTGVTYAQTYFYWARPLDASLNVGSFFGPATFVASFIVTTDIDSNAISNLNELAGGSFTLTADAWNVCASLGIVSKGGNNLVVAKVEITNGNGVNKAITTVGLFRALLSDPGSAAFGTLIENARISLPPAGASNTFGAVTLVKLDPSVGSTYVYLLSVNPDIVDVSVNVPTVQAIEIKR